MVIVHGLDTLLSLDASGLYGLSADLGFGALGAFGFGADDIYAGTYQHRRTLKGPAVSRGLHYGPANPQTVAQQAWRSVFRAGTLLWQSLTPTQKKSYSVSARRLGMSEYNFFISQYLSTHRL